jgi:hypothetical protein
MGTILFLLLLFFVIIPLFKIGGAFWNARRQFKQFYNTMSGDGHQNNQSRQTEQHEGPKRKKYAPTDGEYVAFEDIEVTETRTEQDGSKQSRTHSEQQIVDVEWEDI